MERFEIVSMDRIHIKGARRLGLNTQELATYGTTPNFWSEETLAKWLAENVHDILLVAQDNKAVAGFIIVMVNPLSRDAWIIAIAVAEAFRHRGIGQKLIETALARIREKGCNHVYAFIQVNNEPARQFLGKVGFSQGRPFHFVGLKLPKKGAQS